MRYFWPSVHSANFELMPRKPARIIQNTAPGPPRPTATATPAMLPSPTVAESAAESAWKCEISPVSPGCV
jgi:hypothetical protein